MTFFFYYLLHVEENLLKITEKNGKLKAKSHESFNFIWKSEGKKAKFAFENLDVSFSRSAAKSQKLKLRHTIFNSD